MGSLLPGAKHSDVLRRCLTYPLPEYFGWKRHSILGTVLANKRFTSSGLSLGLQLQGSKFDVEPHPSLQFGAAQPVPQHDICCLSAATDCATKRKVRLMMAGCLDMGGSVDGGGIRPDRRTEQTDTRQTWGSVQNMAVDSDAFQDPLDVIAGFGEWHQFDPVDGIDLPATRVPIRPQPSVDARRPGIVRRKREGIGTPIVRKQLGQISTAKHDVVA